MKDLKKRVLEVSHKFNLSHIGSCLTAVGIIDGIYQVKQKSEPFVLSSGHAHIAHLVVMEKHEGKKIEKIHDIHCNFKDGCDAPTGSLGQGLPIAVGMAIADKTKNVYALLSDGECAEGSVWEALRIAAKLKLENLRITVNANGYSAIGRIDIDWLDMRLQYFYPTLVIKTDLFGYPSWIQGVLGHYKIMSDEEYEEVK